MRCDFGHCWELDYSTFANACWHEERDRKRLDENENYNRKSLSTREVEMKPHKINIPEGTYFEKYSIPFSPVAHCGIHAHITISGKKNKKQDW